MKPQFYLNPWECIFLPRLGWWWLECILPAMSSGAHNLEEGLTHMIHLSPNSCSIYDFPFHFQDCPVAYSPQILTLGTATNSFPFLPHQPGWSQLPGAPLLPSHLALVPSSTWAQADKRIVKMSWYPRGCRYHLPTTPLHSSSETPVRAEISRHSTSSP